MRQRTGLILLIVGLVLVIAGVQGKLGAVLAAILSPGDVMIGSSGSSVTLPVVPAPPLAGPGSIPPTPPGNGGSSGFG